VPDAAPRAGAAAQEEPMRRMLLLSVLVASLAHGGCERAPAPPPQVQRTPADGKVMAGGRIELRATKPLTADKEAFEYTWSTAGDCAGAIADPSAWKIEYEVPADCGGGKLTFTLGAKSRLGTTTESFEFQIAPKPKEVIGVEPVRPDPLPATWAFVNDYEGTLAAPDQQRRNKWAPDKGGGFFGTYTYRDGKCELAAETADGAGALKLSYALPHSKLSACGYFEYFEGPPGDAKKADISGFSKVSFVAKSTTGERVTLRLELVEFDKYANYNQGIVSESEPLVVDGQWRRHELDLKELAATWKLSSTKSVGFRIDAKDGNPGAGAILVDHLVLVRKEGAAPTATAPQP